VNRRKKSTELNRSGSYAEKVRTSK